MVGGAARCGSERANRSTAATVAALSRVFPRQVLGGGVTADVAGGGKGAQGVVVTPNLAVEDQPFTPEGDVAHIGGVGFREALRELILRTCEAARRLFAAGLVVDAAKLPFAVVLPLVFAQSAISGSCVAE